MQSNSHKTREEASAEKRQGYRVPYEGDVFFRSKKADRLPAFVKDVSESGAFLITPQILPLHGDIFLEIPLPFGGKNKLCRVSTTVVRLVKDKANSTQGYGLKFSSDFAQDSKKLLIEYIAKKKEIEPISNSEESFARLLVVSRELQFEGDIRQVSERIVALAMELIECERVALYRMEGDKFVTLASRNLGTESIIELVNKEMKVGQLFKELNRPFLCSPFSIGKNFKGTLYVDRYSHLEPFTSLDSLVLDGISEQASISLERVFMAEEVRKQQEKIRYLNEQLNQQNKDKPRSLDLLAKSQPQKISGILGSSEKIKQLLETTEQAAQSDAPVYIFGESGTGKELIARTLHGHSPKREKPFVAVQCGTIPNNLFESFFFGHVKGAFTGADQDQTGVFNEANGGVLFLDEIDALPLDVQAKFLRVLEESKVRPVGGLKETSVSVRIVTASNRDLDELVAKGEFREDLYYRLHVIRIDVPPLREHLEDVSILAENFLRVACERQGIPEPVLGEEALSALMNFAWPGNVRQLKNEIDRIVAMLPKSKGGKQQIKMEMVSHEILKSRYSVAASGSLAKMLDKFSRDSIINSLEKNKGNKSQVAKELGLSRFGLRKMIQRLKIEVN